MKLKLVLLASAAIIIVTACTKDLTPNLPDYGTNTVVEGSIETSRPPVVLLTRSTKIFGDLNVNDLASFFVHGATITMTVDSAGPEIPLPELCVKDLSIPDSLKRSFLAQLGYVFYDTSRVPDVCVYTLPVADLSAYFNGGACPSCGQEQHSSQLKIKTGKKTLTATTTIPKAIGINGLSVDKKVKQDSLVTVLINFTVPPSFGNFIRYSTKRNNEPFYYPYTGSVYDDKFFSGKTFTLPLERGVPSNATNVDANTFGYFWKGDTVVVKWSSIDAKTFNFYSSIEQDGGGSPFSSPVRVQSNIVGDSCIGIWAGFAAKYYNITIPK
jgi:hypothetical protein